MTTETVSVNPVEFKRRAVDPEVYELTRQGIEVAEAIGLTEPFSYGHAKYSLRTVAALFNMSEAGTAEMLDKLSPVQTQRLLDLSVRSYAALGKGARENAEAGLHTYRPASERDAEIILMRHSFTALQVAVSNGPGSEGYEPKKEWQVRELVKDYAEVFASVYCELSTMGHHFVTNPTERKYFMEKIHAADPRDIERGRNSHPDNGGASDGPAITEFWM